MSHRSVPKWSVAGKMIGRLRDAEAKCDWFNWGEEENSNELQKISTADIISDTLCADLAENKRFSSLHRFLVVIKNAIWLFLTAQKGIAV